MSGQLTIVHTAGAPKAIGPYSQAVVAGSLLFVSGQIPMDPASGQMVEGSFADQARRVLDNLDAILTAAGSGRDRVVKVTVFVTDLADFATLNEIYAAFFGDHRPARAVVEVAALPKGSRLEMEAVALL
jgi:2-iminobutanoate/2-iminopropanoate deaminase